MRHSSYHTPSLPSRIGRVLLVLLCSAGVLSGGFLLLCGLGVLSPAAISQQVSAWLHPPAASTPASAPAEALSLPEENDPFQGVFLSLDQLADAQTLADGYDGVILPMKTADGALGYVSALPLAADAGASSGDPDRNEALRALNDTPGLYTVAQVSSLRDSALVREEPGLSLHRVSGSPWLDESRQGWLDPAQTQAQSYLRGGEGGNPGDLLPPAPGRPGRHACHPVGDGTAGQRHRRSRQRPDHRPAGHLRPGVDPGRGPGGPGGV